MALSKYYKSLDHIISAVQFLEDGDKRAAGDHLVMAMESDDMDDMMEDMNESQSEMMDDMDDEDVEAMKHTKSEETGEEEEEEEEGEEEVTSRVARRLKAGKTKTIEINATKEELQSLAKIFSGAAKKAGSKSKRTKSAKSRLRRVAA